MITTERDAEFPFLRDHPKIQAIVALSKNLVEIHSKLLELNDMHSLESMPVIQFPSTFSRCAVTGTIGVPSFTFASHIIRLLAMHNRNLTPSRI